MIERIRYIKDDFGEKSGVVDIVYDKGYFGLGISLCSVGEDKFVKAEGKKIAHERALESLKEFKMLVKDFSHIRENWGSVKKYSKCNIPLGVCNMGFPMQRDYDTYTTVCDTFEDMLYTLAIAKSRADIKQSEEN